MEERAYVLLSIVSNCSVKVIEILRGWPGVLIADRLEDSQDVMLVIGAPDRAKLIERVVRTLARVESMTEDITLLPANAGYIRPAYGCHKG